MPQIFYFMNHSEMHRKPLFLILTLLILAVCLLVSGCGKRLPDPQVIRREAVPSTVPTQTPVPTASPAPVQEPTPSPAPTETAAVPAALHYEVPVLSQDGLLLNGAPTGVGCVPVCIEMMTSWWNSVSPEYPVLTAQETIDRNAEQGLYAAGRGMSSASAADELAELGYTHRLELNATREELLAVFREHGPVGVLVKTNWVPGTMNHAAVLTAADEENDLFTFNDPFYGSAVQWSWEAFDGIWGLNYAGDRDYDGTVVRRVYFTIYPAADLKGR